MKKLIYIFSLLIVIILIKYYISDYKVSYTVNNYKVTEEVKDNYTYISIYIDGIKYSFKYDLKRSLNKKIVNKIEINNECVKPIIKGYDTYYICYTSDEYTTMNMSDDNTFDTDIKYNKYLSSNEKVYIWKYNGFYIFDNDRREINILDTDKYSNELMITYDKYLLMPKYNKEYTFSDFYLLDMNTNKYKTIKTKYLIHYDSYYTGTYKNKIYLFDNKSNELYEIDINKLKVKLIGNEFLGYIKYVNNKKKTANLIEYTKDKIIYFKEEDNFIYVDKNKFSFDNNTWITYFKEDNIQVVKVYKDTIYFIYEDNLYKYKDSKVNLIIHYFEYNFNNNDITFIHNS